jgi:SAM-dependent methyltransferase
VRTPAAFVIQFCAAMRCVIIRHMQKPHKKQKTAVGDRTGSHSHKPGKKVTRAESADRHRLYELAVQDVDHEFDFVDTTFRKIRGRRANLLREDFCGTANMSCKWVKSRGKNRAIGVDIDPEVLDWGRKHNIAKLRPDARERIELIQEDVLDVKTVPVDVVTAMNFSYQLFKTRKQLKDYFSSVRASLADDGILFMDAYGGYDSYREIKEKRKLKGFTYIWEQAHYSPISGEMTCYIHFKFPDKSKLRRAFSYNWRLWTLPELRELLDEAGFSRVTVHWEGTDEETGEGDGIYSPATVGDADPSWVCFITAEK